MDRVEQVKSLRQGEGVQYLVDAAARIFENPVSVVDLNYNVIALSDHDVDDPIWQELVKTGRFSEEAEAAFSRGLLMEALANADGCVVLRSEEIDFARMGCYFFNRENIKAGLVGMYEQSAPFDEEAQQAFELFAAAITAEIRDDELYNKLGRAFHSDMIKALIDGFACNGSVYTPHVQVLFDGFEEYLFLAVVDPSHGCVLQNGTDYHRDRLMHVYPSYKYAVHCGAVLVLMSSTQPLFIEETFFGKYYDLIERDNLLIGVSECFENIYELSKYYCQALEAVKDFTGKEDGKRIFTYRQ